jgi:hypothetical protein
MKFVHNPLGPTEVLEVFNANVRTVEAALGDQTFDNDLDMRRYMGKSKKQAADMTREQVGNDAWQKFVGASGRGWRVSRKSST